MTHPTSNTPNLKVFKMARSSAVPRTLKLLREAGFTPWVVEQYNAFSGKRSDLFGFADILAITESDTVAVQVCGADFASHVRKMTGEAAPLLSLWLREPARTCLLIGWRKLKAKRGGKQMVFKPRIVEFRLGIARALIMREYKNDEPVKQILAQEWETE